MLGFVEGGVVCVVIHQLVEVLYQLCDAPNTGETVDDLGGRTLPGGGGRGQGGGGE